ncbi:uncharacterized protein BDZ99DRAFT_459705, partial [Mytilinidion resinicola]
MPSSAWRLPVSPGGSHRCLSGSMPAARAAISLRRSLYSAQPCSDCQLTLAYSCAACLCEISLTACELLIKAPRPAITDPQARNSTMSAPPAVHPEYPGTV